MSAPSSVLLDHTTLTLPKVGTLLVSSCNSDSARLMTDFEQGGTSKGYDKAVVIHRVEYTVDLLMRDMNTVPEGERHKWSPVNDPWAYQRAIGCIRHRDWRRNDYPSEAARNFFREHIVEPFATWLQTPEAAALRAGGAQSERDQLRQAALGSIEKLSAKQAELMLLLGQLERGERLSEDEKTVLRNTRLEYRR